MSETLLKVGSKGEIFTTKALRREAKIRKGGRVRATVTGTKLILESLPSIEEILQNPVLKIRVDEAEKLSEEAQKEEAHVSRSKKVLKWEEITKQSSLLKLKAFRREKAGRFD